MVRQLIHSETETKSQKSNLVIVCDGVILPANIGMIFRIGEAMGVKSIHLCGENEVLESKKVLKASRSTLNKVECIRYPCTTESLNMLKATGYTIVVLELTDKSIDLRKTNFSSFKNIAIVIGAENFGVSDGALNLADMCTYIPMFGENTSMNVATALSVCLFEVVRQTS